MTLAEAVAAEIRSRRARIPYGIRPSATQIGVELSNGQGNPRSQNYVSARLRGEQPFSLDEVETIAGLLGVTLREIFASAIDAIDS